MRWVPWAKKIKEAHEKGIAGAVTVPSGAPVEVGGVKTQGWQIRAWQLWNQLGELHYPTSHLARQVGRLHWKVSVDGLVLTDETGDALLEMATFGLGLREASRLLALNLQVAGDTRYVQNADGTWSVYAVTTPNLDEIWEEAQKAGRLRFRLWNPDPIEPEKADSSFKTVIGPAEELLTLAALSRAQSRSRISQAGMLLVPNEASFGEADPFGADLERAMMAPIADVEHPSAMVPIKVEMDEDLIESPRHITFERPYDNRIHEKQERAIRRVALAEDIPPELLLGVDTVTHWTAWLVALETYTSHLEPLAAPIGELYADVITAFYERDAREVLVEVEPDPGELLAKRSTVRDAMDAAKLGAVGLAYVREAIGAEEEDAPTEDELELLRLIPREPGREIMVDEQTGPPAETAPIAAALETYDKHMSEADQGHDFERGRLEGALAVAADTARTRVGSKLRTHLRGSELATLIDGVHNRDVVATLGLDRINGSFDLNRAMIDALVPFSDWWSTAAISDLPAGTASLLVGIWVADTLATPSAEATAVPDRLIGDLLNGIGIKETAHAP